MNKEISTAQDIFDLNDKKEYTLTATPILDKILTESRLTAQAAKIWQYLFNKARYNHDLSVSISYANLSKLFNKKNRTIIRWIKSLQLYGYLLIKKNYDAVGSQTINTFFVRIPKEVVEFARSSKDRKNNSNNSTKNKSYSLSITNLEKLPPAKARIIVPKEKRKKENNICSAAPFLPIEINPINLLQINNKSIKISEIKLKEDDQDNVFFAKNVMGGDDNNVTLNNNLKDNTNNNNTTVVSLELKTLEEKEIALNKQKEIEHKLFDEILSEFSTGNKTHEDYCKQSEKLSNIEIQLIRLKDAKGKIEKSFQLNQKTAAIYQEKEFIKNLRGNRAMSDFTYKRLVKGLSQLGYKDIDLIQLVNETAFAIRFGSLKNTKDKIPMGMEKGVNIVLKLVREGRWETPTELKKFCEEI